MAKFLHNKELFPPHQLPKKDNGVAKPSSRLFDWEELERRPILTELVLILVALGFVFVSAYVFLDFRVSKYLSLLGL